MTTEELTKLIKTRRSIRLFQDKPVPEELLLQAVETATWAPNGGNAQNWRFLIITDKKLIRQVDETIKTELQSLLAWPEMTKGRPASAPRPGNPQPGSPMSTAPALIAVSTIRSANPMLNAMLERSKTDAKAKQMVEGMQTVAAWAQSTSAAVAYLMLVLHQQGLGTLWMTGPLHAKAEIEKLLNIPAGEELMTLVPVGYPAETPTRERKPVSEVCRVIK